MTSSEGLPKRSVISSSWWATFFPGKRGRPRSTYSRENTGLVVEHEEHNSKEGAQSSNPKVMKPKTRYVNTSTLFAHTSAKMHPMDQMSMAGEYFAKKLPQSSGALYHLESI